VSIATLGLALSAHAANVKLGTDTGSLVFDPDTVTIKAGESVTWTNNAGEQRCWHHCTAHACIDGSACARAGLADLRQQS
jgi:plastocyanin